LSKPPDVARKPGDLRMLEKIIVKGYSGNQRLEAVRRPSAKGESPLEADQWALQCSADLISVDEDQYIVRLNMRQIVPKINGVIAGTSTAHRRVKEVETWRITRPRSV
jgi:hypothetical protein